MTAAQLRPSGLRSKPETLGRENTTIGADSILRSYAHGLFQR